jgi:hypothetical protein
LQTCASQGLRKNPSVETDGLPAKKNKLATNSLIIIKEIISELVAKKLVN